MLATRAVSIRWHQCQVSFSDKPSTYRRGNLSFAAVYEEESTFTECDQNKYINEANFERKYIYLMYQIDQK